MGAWVRGWVVGQVCGCVRACVHVMCVCVCVWSSRAGKAGGSAADMARFGVGGWGRGGGKLAVRSWNGDMAPDIEAWGGWGGVGGA